MFTGRKAIPSSLKCCGSGPCRTCCARDRNVEGINADGPPTAPSECGSEAAPNLPTLQHWFVYAYEEGKQAAFSFCARSANTDVWRSKAAGKLRFKNDEMSRWSLLRHRKDQLMRAHLGLLFLSSRSEISIYAQRFITLLSQSTGDGS